MKVIIQKAIAASGYCSRRKAEDLVRNGEVEVNGVQALIGQMVNPDRDSISIAGKSIAQTEQLVYIKLNKPTGYVCTNRKFPSEKSIFDLVKVKERLFPVGRLDKESCGLVLLTNDGALAQKLSHPRFEHNKVYLVRLLEHDVNGPKLAKALEKGIDIGEEDGVVYAKRAEYLQNSDFAITLNEGKKRQIRRMFKACGFSVSDLQRVVIAGLELGSLREGMWEYLSESELRQLRMSARN